MTDKQEKAPEGQNTEGRPDVANPMRHEFSHRIEGAMLKTPSAASSGWNEGIEYLPAPARTALLSFLMQQPGGLPGGIDAVLQKRRLAADFGYGMATGWTIAEQRYIESDPLLKAIDELLAQNGVTPDARMSFWDDVIVDHSKDRDLPREANPDIDLDIDDLTL